MIIVMKPGIPAEEELRVKSLMESKGFQIHESRGANFTLFGVVGDTAAFDMNQLRVYDCIDKVMRVQEPYKRANRMFHPEDSIVDVCGVKVGGKQITVMAGPCSVETREQIIGVAEDVKQMGAAILRGGAFKPRTSPYSFQGLQETGLDLLKEAKAVTGLPIITEIMSADKIERFVEDVDVIQVGARNMQNFILLKEAGRSGLPVLLKRGLCATIDEWLNAAEYIMAEGNPNVVLCERGIRTYETSTRNTLDLSAVPVLKERTHLPVIVDPSHATGAYRYVPPMAKAAVACGADGLMIEVHNDPAHALSDGAQSLTYDSFHHTMNALRAVAAAVDREI